MTRPGAKHFVHLIGGLAALDLRPLSLLLEPAYSNYTVYTHMSLKIRIPKTTAGPSSQVMIPDLSRVIPCQTMVLGGGTYHPSETVQATLYRS